MTNEDVIAVLTETEARSKSNTKRLDKLEQKQDELGELVTSVALIAQRQETIDGDVKEIKADIKTLTEKPGKKWDDFTGKLFWLFVAAVVGFALAKLGLG